MLFPVKPWAIAILARRTYIRSVVWSKMQVFCLTRFESSLVGSVHTDSLRMSPFPVTKAVYLPLSLQDLLVHLTFLISSNHNQFMGICIFFCMPWRFKSTCRFVGKCLWQTIFKKCMRLCVGCTAFAYVCVQILRVKRLLSTFVYSFCVLSGFCVHLCKAFAC